ncbi:hypothetical protein [Gordonia sp. (in: high G+C Gram-positive bacteria)]|jgi:hypothetical protein|uniref:hypothetical protein n=1 Tax=Gordonia sp. (in: high G+C Gram-positive bacteria) TaxID=84139 RepID=UPI00261A7F2B|nr:hypothetical protein [Gordonia sp. (in: high G+C Gram-positive bacteria)]HMS74442.1 hypothetical protein [Gordonia sp. (in: high G+C Gram-positive bacteria)]
MNRCGRSLVLILSFLIVGGLFAGCSSDSDDGPGGASLPANFPRKEVPLLTDGTVLSVSGDEDDGWSVTMQGLGAEGNALDAAVKKLTAAGYTVSQRTTDAGRRVVLLTKKSGDDAYWVQVGTIAGAAGGPNALFYQVTRVKP